MLRWLNVIIGATGETLYMTAEGAGEIARRTALLAGIAGLAAGCATRPVRQATGRWPDPASGWVDTTTTPSARNRHSSRGTDNAPAPRPAPRPPTLPTGERTVFPRHRLVGLCGAPGAESLGAMTGDLKAAGGRLAQQAAAYRGDRAVLPVVELIATVVSSSPGPDGKYRTRSNDTIVGDYLEQARALRGLLLLNIQPGLADFLPEVRAYERWLNEPDVGVALDPEWAVEPGVLPGEGFGTTTGVELDGVSAYLSRLVAESGLPEKVMVYHQVAASVVRSEQGLRRHPGVAAVKSVDGIGDPGLKLATWRTLMAAKPRHVQAGFKLFYAEDTEAGPLMTPAQVLGLRPEPAYVMYE